MVIVLYYASLSSRDYANALTWNIFRFYLLCFSTVSDTCVAMEEWVEHPHAETALSNILPCVDQRTTNKTLSQSKQVINDIVNVVNQFIYTYANTYPSPANPYYYNQSGPLMPPLCYPYDSQLRDSQCGDQEVSISNASLVRIIDFDYFSHLDNLVSLYMLLEAAWFA